MPVQSPTHVSLSQLSIDEKSNIRKTGRGAEPAFVSSIREKGIIEPLIVRQHEGNGFTITNGSKRFDALLFLKDKGDKAAGEAVTDKYRVPIIVRQETDAEARDTSLVTAIVHAPPHPVDCYEAFAQLRKEGVEVAQIAATYAMTENVVEQTLALGALSPAVRKAWREGSIQQAAAQAFTMATSAKQQDQVLEQLIKKRGKFQYVYGGDTGLANAVRQAIVGDKQGDAFRFVNFVGIPEYEAKGGTVIRDLFKGQHAVSDPALAKQLADEKVLATCAILTGAGWAWAKPDGEIKDSYLYGAINHKPKFTDDEKARIKTLEAVINKGGDSDDEEDEQAADDANEEVGRITAEAEGRAFTDAEKAKSGCAVEISNTGKLKVTYGLIPPKDRKDKAGQGARMLASDDDARPAAPKAKPPASNKISNALAQRLDKQLDKATRTAITSDKHPNALCEVLAACVAKQIDVDSNWSRTPDAVKKALPALRDAVTPSVMRAALDKAFDASGYFEGAPAKLRVKALEEMGCTARPAKAAAVIDLCCEFQAKTKWYPPEMRTAAYDGPGTKAKAAAKPKKKR